MQHRIPDEVRRSILANIDSVAQLEALLLFRTHPQHKWTCNGVAERIYMTEKETAAVLGKLVARELIETKTLEPRMYYSSPRIRTLLHPSINWQTLIPNISYR